MTPAHRRWIALGEPWELARPISELRDWARDNGVRVLGTLGDTRHLAADPPEDHTPFSATAWPVDAFGYVCAIDLENVRDLGKRMEAMARRGELPWLKYLNHGGRTVDVRTGWVAYTSDDEHVHASCRSDYIHKSIGEFNPFGDHVLTERFTDGPMEGRTVQEALNTILTRTNYLTNVLGIGPRLDAILKAANDDPQRPAVITPGDRTAIVGQLVRELEKLVGRVGLTVRP